MKPAITHLCLPLFLLIAFLAAAQGPPPAHLPAVLMECDSGPNYKNCGSWVWNGLQYEGNWQTGATGLITITSGNSKTVIAKREDTKGTTAGLTASYSAAWDGTHFVGRKVAWTWQGKSDTFDWTGDSSIPVTWETHDLSITNLYPARLTAFSITEWEGSGPVDRNEDFHLVRRGPGLGKFGKGHPNLNPSAAIGPEGAGFHPVVVAAIFSDGTALGDPKEIQALMGRRNDTQREVKAYALDVCSQIQKGGTFADVKTAWPHYLVPSIRNIIHAHNPDSWKLQSAFKISQTYRNELLADPVKDKAGKLYITDTPDDLSCQLP